MELYKFDKDSGKKITKFHSNFTMSRIMQTEKTTHIGCMHLEGNDVIGFHQAVIPQLLLIMNGEGYVRGEEETQIKVQSGDAVFWKKGEWHETKTDIGLTAIVIESEDLNPASFMPIRK
ncbi:cupin [Radiobacillus kanasensis]|uniref:cupin n=1 Tax=Radiobacillus kanasensis TaxID=2844358 RepID=UPI001E303759|nr:cupin [Radiobacillus kanasensis]UFT99741.1 cupin [Radiobacillus kanasensis]